MDLRKPEHLEWDEVDEKWEDLTERLFTQLQDAFAKGLTVDFPAQQGHLESWKPFIQRLKEKKEQNEYQWEVANRMLLCAEQAARHPKRDWNEIDRLSLALAQMPESLQGHEDWAVDCVRLLLGYTPPFVRRLDIPVALSDELTSTQGSLATLRLEIVPPRGGGAYHYPPNSLLTYLKPDFSEALLAAWTAANALALQQEAANYVAGRWQILLSGHPAKEIGGRSASAAAALGWYHLLHGTKPDDGIIVLAQIDRHGRLDGVGGVPAKVKAIVEACPDRFVGRNRCFDTIVVASDDNQDEAEEVLRKCNMRSHIRVVRHTTLESLISVRSWLVQELLDYLDNLASRATELPAYYPAHLRTSERGKTRFDDIRQMVQVVEDRSAFSKWVAEERERSRAAGMDVGRLAYAPNRARPEIEVAPQIPSEADNYEKPAEQKPPVLWDKEAGKRFKRAVILADPGFGKTWLLRYEARRLAREEAQHLREGSKSLSEIILPIFVRLSDVNRDDMPLEESLLTLIGQKRSSVFRTFVREKMESERCAILFDAWDEVPIEIPQVGQPIAYKPHYRQRLGQRLSAFATHFPKPRLLMTSRIVGYIESPIPDAQELELIAFDSLPVETFVHIWFKDNTQANQFLAMLRQNHAVRGLTRIPLMLTLVCRAYEENQLTFATRCVDLYESCLRGLLRDWKEEKVDFGAQISDAEVDAQLELLQAISYPLFAEEYEQFDERLLRRKIIQWLRTLEPWHDFYGTKPPTLIKVLKRDGILISAGENRNAPLLFLHRTFHEYLAARALAERANQEGWHTITDLINQKAWLANWPEVIILLAGQLDEPTSLLELLADERKDDYFRHRLALATLCLPEIPATIRDQQITIIDQITTEIFNLCWQYELGNTLDKIPHLVRALPALAQGGGRVRLPSANSKMALPDTLISLLDNEKSGTRNTAMRLIGKLGSRIATERFLESLSALLRHDDERMRDSALEAVTALGEAAVTDAFLESLSALLRHDDERLRSDAAKAVKALGKAAATDAFLERLSGLFHHNDERVRDSALKAVTVLGEAAATDAFLESLLALLRHDDERVRDSTLKAVTALGEAAATDAFLESLSALLRHDDERVRDSALKAVTALGEAAATDAFLENLSALLHHDDERVRDLALEAVAALGKAVATDAFLESLSALLRHDDERVRDSALKALKALGEAAATDAFLERLSALLRHDDERVRSDATRAARTLGKAAATPAILEKLSELLHDENETERSLARNSLSAQGKAAATDTILKHLSARLCNQDKEARIKALKAVKALGEAAATPAILERLLALLHDDDERVRHSALETVRALGEAAAMPAILEKLSALLRDEYSHVRSSAAEVLNEMMRSGVRVFQTSEGFKRKMVKQLAKE